MSQREFTADARLARMCTIQALVLVPDEPKNRASSLNTISQLSLRQVPSTSIAFPFLSLLILVALRLQQGSWRPVCVLAPRLCACGVTLRTETLRQRVSQPQRQVSTHYALPESLGDIVH